MKQIENLLFNKLNNMKVNFQQNEEIKDIDNDNNSGFDNILELNQRRTGKAKFEQGESGTVRGNIKIAYMMLKEAELNMQSEKCKNAMKILEA